MKKIMFLALAVTALAGCDQPEPTTGMAEVSDGRVTVQRIGVFEDKIAYGSRRGIYVITDTKTGREFIGVSGVGVAETSAHTDDDSTTQDER